MSEKADGAAPIEPTGDGKTAATNTLVENMFAPEVFSSFASSFAIASGAVTIKLVSARWDNSVEPAVQRAVVVGRITMPLQGAQTLAAGLTSFLGKLGLEIGQADIPRKRASDAVASSPILRS